MRIIIETERLILREMTEADFDALYKVLADRSAVQYYPYSFDEERVRGWIDRNIGRYRVFGFGLWAVCSVLKRYRRADRRLRHDHADDRRRDKAGGPGAVPP